ncbi:uncharacterized protein LOC135815028 [Sycon ciliatum]|uniref:uncharacterized protein LOC135815028 n=1 Tax=Sycon ciliatum TaxID=27933 RepID=UPI0031F6B7C4
MRSAGHGQHPMTLGSTLQDNADSDSEAELDNGHRETSSHTKPMPMHRRQLIQTKWPALDLLRKHSKTVAPNEKDSEHSVQVARKPPRRSAGGAETRQKLSQWRAPYFKGNYVHVGEALGQHVERSLYEFGKAGATASTERILDSNGSTPSGLERDPDMIGDDVEGEGLRLQGGIKHGHVFKNRALSCHRRAVSAPTISTCLGVCSASSVGQGTRTGRPARLTSSSCVDAYKQKPLQSSVDSRASGKGSLRVEWRKVCKKVPEEERERDPPKEMWADKRQTSSAKTSMETSPNNNQLHRKAIIDHPSIPEVPIFSAHRTDAISTTDEKDQGIDHFYPKTQLSAAHQGFRVRNQPRPFKTGLRPRQLPGHSYQAPEKALPSVQVQAFRRPKKPSITSGFTPPVVSHVPEPVFVDVSGLRAPHSSPRISKAPTKSALHSFRS